MEAFLRRDAALHAYELGDLDPAFAPFTRWFVGEGAVALLYTASDPATLLCFHREPAQALPLLRSLELPDELYAHLSPGLLEALPHRVIHRSQHLKMALAELHEVPLPSEPALLGPEHEDELLAFYAVSYPDNWFDPRMLRLEPYVGLREGGELMAVAGLHVWSSAYGVAAIGNVAVHPHARGRGLGAAVTWALCQRLRGRAQTIALNVQADNTAAISAYRRVGFVPVAPYEEVRLTISGRSRIGPPRSAP
jgi:ribosomal protein S18 acetylase RimI-like enzyme